MKKWISPEAERFLGLGLQLAGSILLGFFGGFYADRKLGTLPWFTLGGCAAGIAAGFTGFILQLKSMKTDENSK